MSEKKSPLVRIRPPRRWEALDLSVLWRFRELAWALAVRDIKLRYRQTALGVAWVVFQPLLGAGIFAFVFGKVAKLDSGGTPYLVFSYAGLLAWNLFSSTVLKAAGSLVTNAPLVSKIFFPRLILPFSAAISSLLDFAIGLVAGVVLMLAQGHALALSPALLIVLVLLLVLALGLGLLCSALSVAYRDVLHLLPVAMQLLLYASPIGYAITVIPAEWRSLYLLNPLAPLIDGFRVALVGGGVIDPGALAGAAAISIGVFVVGLVTFRRRERQFADVI